MQGWRPDGTFCIGNTLYSAHLDPQRAVFDVIGNRVAGGFGQAGSVEGWAAGMEMLLAKGYEAYAFACLASLSAPLMQLFSDCGMVISIQSAKNEWRDLMVQALTSPWGDRACLSVRTQEPLEERVKTWRALGNFPAFYEDIMRLDPYTQQKFIPEVLKHSKLMFCCNSEGAPDDEKVLVLNHKYRRRFVLEIGAEVDTKYRLDHTQVKVMLNKNYGSAAPRLYQYAVRNLGAIQGTVKQLEERFYEDIKKNNHNMRPFAALLGALATTAMVCQKLGVLPVTPERITRWALDAITLNHTGRPMFASDPEELLAKYMLEQYEHLAILSGEDEGFNKGMMRYYEPRPGQHVNVRYDYIRNRVYIDSSDFTQWLRPKGYVGTYIRKELMERGVAVRDKYVFNFHSRMNGWDEKRGEAMILDARKETAQAVIQEWAQKLELQLPPHQGFAEFVSFRERARLRTERRLALAQQSQTEPSPPPEDAPEN